MDITWWDALITGMTAVWGWQALGLIALGVAVGSVFGVLPGLGPVAAIALLLPATLGLPALPALLVLAGVYYGAQYGGSLPAIVLDQPGEASSVMTSHDGHPLALQGRAGAALVTATLSSFLAGCLAIGAVILLAPWMVSAGMQFGASERFLVLVVGLVGATVLASGSFLKALAMTVLGLLLGLVGWDAQTGSVRFVPVGLEPWMGHRQGLTDGVGFIALALGFFVVAPVAAELAGLSTHARTRPLPEGASAHPRAAANGMDTRPTRGELRDALPALLRGTGLGAALGVVPGGGALLASLAAYRLEVVVSRQRVPALGQGNLRGVVAPEAANNAGAQTAYLPMLALGVPPNTVMALLLGALGLHAIEPGPSVMELQPTVFWGLLVSMWVGNLFLLALNLPLARWWAPALLHVLRVPRRALLAALLVAAGLGALALGPHGWGVWLVMGLGLLGFVLQRLGCEGVALLLGYVLAPGIEEHLRRALQLSRGDWFVFLERPVSALLLMVAIGLLLVVVLQPRRRASR
ncbi:MAG: tripartite tricarboxylate transporter permease [Hydrogenophaga sp.]|jgi:putative tricarboxylic transport membrane protein|uniref:tripartite tricarboxylate transporter permease n=1 Tax=Hydrogenophaga sp. TaxID=1904254 RepID=UPI00262BCA25|nr:tripartite tricarboxylate transporter permease [Hydrogenophaga sp.]MCV0439434.1 tripartite tricarboxylate transporter permease [Hydrogenophaga sp.]